MPFEWLPVATTCLSIKVHTHQFKSRTNSDTDYFPVDNTLVLLIEKRGLLFSFSIIKKIETRDIYNEALSNHSVCSERLIL